MSYIKIRPCTVVMNGATETKTVLHSGVDFILQRLPLDAHRCKNDIFIWLQGFILILAALDFDKSVRDYFEHVCIAPNVYYQSEPQEWDTMSTTLWCILFIVCLYGAFIADILMLIIPCKESYFYMSNQHTNKCWITVAKESLSCLQRKDLTDTCGVILTAVNYYCKCDL